MAEENLVTNIVAKSNFSDLIADLGKVSSRLTNLQSQLNVTNKALALQAAQMQASFAATMRSTGQFATHFVSLSSDVDKFGKNLDSGKMKLNQYYKAWQDHAKTSGGLIRDLAKQQVMMQNAILQPLGRNAQGLMQFNVHVPQGLDVVKNKTAIAAQELRIMNKVIQDGANQIINWGKNTQWAGRQLTMGLTLPIASFGAAAAKAFREADQELVRLTKVYGGVAATSTADLKKIREEVSSTAKELSSTYGSSYKDTISLAADLAATGKQGNDLLKATQETTRLAVLGEVDRQEAMKATLAIQNAFKQNTTQLSESINFLNAVENQTSTSLQDLVEAIPKAGPVIQAMGGSVKDLALYMTAMKEGGINASEGANALKSALASLVNPTKVAKDMFKGFGIDLSGIVNKNAGNLTGTILELQSALDQLDPLKKQQAIEQLFGKFQFARMNALFANLGKQGSQTLQVLDLMKASSQDLANIAGRELSQVTESASGKYKRAVETLKAEMAGVGDQFLSVGTKLINVINSVLKFFNKMPEPLKAIIGFVGGLTALAGPVIMLTGLMANFFGYIVKGIFHFKSFLKGGEGFKLLTPEIMAAEKAGNLLERSFYNDAKASAVLRQAISNLTAELGLLETKANNARISVGPAIQTVAGNVIKQSTRGGVEVDKENPLIGKPYSRQFAHLIPAGTEQPGSIFGVVPNPGPVNVRIGKNAQYYSNERLPNIEGVTSVKGVSGGVVAEEAAKWHSMTAALAMQSKSEIADLKREVAATGNITASLSESYTQLLPQMTNVTSIAADEAKLIVDELNAGKITVDSAKAKIVALNARIEKMIAETALMAATSQGRLIDVNTVPLTGQPAVDPLTGKSNMKELFHKGPTSALVDKIAGVLGVRTSGAGYSAQTVRFPKYDKGGRVEKFSRNKTKVSGPSSVKYDDRFGEVPLNGYVLNQKAALDPKNRALVEAAPSTYSSNPSTTYAALTPHEIVFGPEIMKNPALYAAVDAANNGYNFGGQIVRGIRGYGPKSPFGPATYEQFLQQEAAKALAETQGKSTYAKNLIVEYAKGIKPSNGVIRGSAQAIMKMFGKEPTKSQSFNEFGQLITVRGGKETITPGLIAKPATGLYGGEDFVSLNRLLSGKGVVGADVRRLVRDFLNGGDGKTIFGSTSQFTDAIAKHGIITDQLSQEIRREINSKFIRELFRMKRNGTPITDDNNPYHDISAQVIGKYTPENANLSNLWEQWIRKTSAINSHTLNEMNRGAGAASNGVINLVLANPAGGIGIDVGKLIGTAGRPFYHAANPVWENKYLKTSGIEKLTAGWPMKNPAYGMGYQYAVNNTDPMHGPLQIGRSMNLGAEKNSEDPYLHNRGVYYSDKFGRLSIDEQFLTGTAYDRGMYATSQYMSGNKAIMAMMENIPTSHPLGPISAMKTLQKKYTGKLFRGVLLGKTHNAVPDDIAKAIIEARKTGVYDALIGKEFIMRRSSWSKDKDVARYFAPGHGVNEESILFEALVRNRNILPAGDLFPKKTFQAPYGQDWGTSRFGNGYKSEQEAIFGGKFRIAGIENGKVQLETVFEAREMGGNVNAGQPYIVGEKGPELFVPRNSGGIVPNYVLGGAITSGRHAYGEQGPMRVEKFTTVGRGGVRTNAYGVVGSPTYTPGLSLPGSMAINRAADAMSRGFWASVRVIDHGAYVLDASLKKNARTISGAFARIQTSLNTSVATLSATPPPKPIPYQGIINSTTGTGYNSVYPNPMPRYWTGARSQPFDTMPLPVKYNAEGNAIPLSKFAGDKGAIFRRSSAMLSPSSYKGMMPKMGAFRAGGMGTWMGGGIAGGAIGGKVGGANGALIGSIALPMLIQGLSALSVAAAAAEVSMGTLVAGMAVGAAPFVIVAAIIASIGIGLYKWKSHLEDVGQAHRAVFGGSDKAFKEVGLTYKSNTERLKEYNQQLQLARTSGIAAYNQNTKVGGAVGLNLSIDELQKGIADAKKNSKESISNINNVGGRDSVIRLAASMKQQYISAGMSVQEATNKVYTLIKASDKAGYAFAAITSKAFNSITDQASAAQYSISNLVAEMKKGSVNAEEMAVGIDNMLSSINSYMTSLVGTKDENGKILTIQDAQQIALTKIVKTSGAWKNVSDDVLNQIKSQDLVLGSVLGKTESLVSIYAKQALVQGGYSGQIDISAMSERDAVLAARGLAAYQGAVDNVVKSTEGPLGGLNVAYNKITAAIKNATNAAKGLNTATDYKKIIKDQTALIKKIKEEADARIKALDAQKASSDFNTELQKEQLAYQSALASGDMTAAAQSQLNIQSLTANRQHDLAVQAIQDAADAKVKAAEAKIAKAQDAIDKQSLAVQAAQTNASNNMAQQTAISTFESTVSRLSSSFTDVTNLSTDDKKSLTGQLKTAISDLIAAGGVAAQKGKSILTPYSSESLAKTGLTPEVAFLDAINNKGQSDAQSGKFGSAVNTFLEAVNAFSKTVGDFNPNAESGTRFNPVKVTASTVSSALEDWNSGKNHTQYKAGDIVDKGALTSKGRMVLMRTGAVVPGQYFTYGSKVYKMSEISAANRNLKWDVTNTYVDPDTKKNYQIVEINTKKAMGGAIPGYVKGGTYRVGDGGYIRGAGTPTSDSIVLPVGNGGVIKASDMEFMQPASAVSYYGTDFMEAIRSRSLPKEMVHAAMGGAIPGYVWGGGLWKSFKNTVGNIFSPLGQGFNSFHSGMASSAASRSMAGHTGGQSVSMPKMSKADIKEVTGLALSTTLGEMTGVPSAYRLATNNSYEVLGHKNIGRTLDLLGLLPLIGGGTKAVRGMGGVKAAPYYIPNKVNQAINQSRVNSMIKKGMWHGSQPTGYRGEEYLQGDNILTGAESYDPYYGMGFFATNSKGEADLYASGYNSLSNWGESYGSLNTVTKAPRGKYIDFTRGTNSLKWQDYALSKALGVKKNGYIGEYMPENLGNIMSGQGMTGAIMNRVNNGMSPYDGSRWLAWNNPAGVHTSEWGTTVSKRPGLSSLLNSLFKPSDSFYGQEIFTNKQIKDILKTAFTAGERNDPVFAGAKIKRKAPWKMGNAAGYYSNTENSITLPWRANAGTAVHEGLHALDHQKYHWSYESLFRHLHATGRGDSAANLVDFYKQATAPGQPANALYEKISAALWKKDQDLYARFRGYKEGHAEDKYHKIAKWFNDNGNKDMAKVLGSPYTAGGAYFNRLSTLLKYSLEPGEHFYRNPNFLEGLIEVSEHMPAATKARLESYVRLIKEYKVDKETDGLHNLLRDATAGGWAIGGSIHIPKFHDGGQVHTKFAGAETMALLQDKERVLTPQQWDALSSKNVSGGDRVYQIAPVINAAEGMDVHALADIATRKTLDAIKSIQYNETRANGQGRLMTK